MLLWYHGNETTPHDIYERKDKELLAKIFQMKILEWCPS